MNRMLYLDKHSLEIENLLNGSKDVIMRAANIKKYPYKMIDTNDHLYLLQTDATELVLASCDVKKAIFIEVTNKEQMDELMAMYKDRVKLNNKKLKYIKERKYISIFILDNIKPEYGTIDHTLSHIEEDWVRFISKK